MVLRTPKGWTGPTFVDGHRVEGTWRAHQVPLADFQQPVHLQQLEAWLNSYRPGELFDANGALLPKSPALAPTRASAHECQSPANGGGLLRALDLPSFTDYAVKLEVPGSVRAEATRVLGTVLRDVMKKQSGLE